MPPAHTTMSPAATMNVIWLCSHQVLSYAVDKGDSTTLCRSVGIVPEDLEDIRTRVGGRQGQGRPLPLIVRVARRSFDRGPDDRR